MGVSPEPERSEGIRDLPGSIADVGPGSPPLRGSGRDDRLGVSQEAERPPATPGDLTFRSDINGQRAQSNAQMLAYQ